MQYISTIYPEYVLYTSLKQEGLKQTEIEMNEIWYITSVKTLLNLKLFKPLNLLLGDEKN